MTTFAISFNELVNNVKNITRNYNEYNVCKKNLASVSNYLDNVNFDMFFTANDIAEYNFVRAKLLDLLDKLYDLRAAYSNTSNEYNIINSVYNTINDFYFIVEY